MRSMVFAQLRSGWVRLRPTAEDAQLLRLAVPVVGRPGMLVVLAGTGVLRGLQDIRTTLVVAAGGAAANVILNVVLVYPLGMGIAGSALGTVIAQCGMAVAYGGVVYRAARE